MGSLMKFVLYYLVALNYAYNFQAYPPLYSLAPANSTMMAQYDFSTVVNATNAIFSNSYSPPACISENPAYCPFVCNCTRPADIQFCSNRDSWGLSFDDGIQMLTEGPSASTPIILDYLKANGLTATFFVVGTQVARFPDTVLRAYNEGHQIGIHTWSHPALTTVANANIVAEIQYTINIVQDIIGTRPVYFRAPYGDVDDRVRSILSAMGLKNALWGMDTGDFNLYNNPNAITEESFTKQVATFEANKPSGIVDLGHDLVNATAIFATTVRIKVIKNSGRNIMSVAACRGDNNPYTGKIQTNGQSANQLVGSNSQVAHSSSTPISYQLSYVFISLINIF
ncbi:chitin deacetylase [Terramyces sp. JEL0728]|nr:chitin deacetylase [Terramyces sp. JEL0728]